MKIKNYKFSLLGISIVFVYAISLIVSISTLKNVINTNTLANTYVKTESNLNITETATSSGGDFISGAPHSYSMGLTDTGDLYVWGEEQHGEFGDGGTSASVVAEADAIEIYDHITGWTAAETASTYNYTTGARLDGGIKDVSLGNHHNLVLMNNGSVWGWGSNNNIRLGRGADGAVGDDTTTIYNSPILIYDGVEPDDPEFVEDFNKMISYSNSIIVPIQTNQYIGYDYYGLTDGASIVSAADAGGSQYINRPIGFWDISPQYYADIINTNEDNSTSEEDTNLVAHRNAIQGDAIGISAGIDNTTITFEDTSSFSSDAVDTSYTYSGYNEGYHLVMNAVTLTSSSFLYDTFDEVDDSFTFDLHGSFGRYTMETSEVNLQLSDLYNQANTYDIDTKFLYLNEDGSKHFTTDSSTTPVLHGKPYHIDTFSVNAWEYTTTDHTTRQSEKIYSYDVNESNAIINAPKTLMEIDTSNPYDLVSLDKTNGILRVTVNILNLNDNVPSDVYFSLKGDDGDDEHLYYSEYKGNSGTGYTYDIYGLIPGVNYDNISIYALDENQETILLYNDDANENLFFVYYEAQIDQSFPVILVSILIIVVLIVIGLSVYSYLNIRKSKKLVEAKKRIRKGEY